MKLDSDHVENPEQQLNGVTFGDLSKMFNFQHRWIYKGSDTTPPCRGGVYWNILKDIYPITGSVRSKIADKLQKHQSMFAS